MRLNTYSKNADSAYRDYPPSGRRKREPLFAESVSSTFRQSRGGFSISSAVSKSRNYITPRQQKSRGIVEALFRRGWQSELSGGSDWRLRLCYFAEFSCENRIGWNYGKSGLNFWREKFLLSGFFCCLSSERGYLCEEIDVWHHLCRECPAEVFNPSIMIRT